MSTTFLQNIAPIGLKITQKIDFDVLSSKMAKYLILRKSHLKFFFSLKSYFDDLIFVIQTCKLDRIQI